jgi:carbon storage regulator
MAIHFRPSVDPAEPVKTWQRMESVSQELRPHNPSQSNSRQATFITEGQVMLVLSRKLGETLVIAGNITIKVNLVRGNTVRFGIDAPKEVSVHRGEVFDRIKKEAASDQACAA